MVLLDRSEVHTIPLSLILNLKFILNSNFFKMVSIQVRFSPRFPLGGRFPSEQLYLRGAQLE
jgi:hypothetical protein